MIPEIRTFFKGVIAEVDSSLSEWTDTFNIDNIPESIIDNSYHIAINDINNVGGDGDITDNTDVIITLFKKGFREPQTAHDEILDKAVNIRLCAIDTAKYNQTFIRNVFSTSINTRDMETNDNLTIVTINLNVFTMFRIYQS